MINCGFFFQKCPKLFARFIVFCTFFIFSNIFLWRVYTTLLFLFTTSGYMFVSKFSTTFGLPKKNNHCVPHSNYRKRVIIWLEDFYLRFSFLCFFRNVYLALCWFWGGKTYWSKTKNLALRQIIHQFIERGDSVFTNRNVWKNLRWNGNDNLFVQHTLSTQHNFTHNKNWHLIERRKIKMAAAVSSIYLSPEGYGMREGEKNIFLLLFFFYSCVWETVIFLWNTDSDFFSTVDLRAWRTKKN